MRAHFIPCEAIMRIVQVPVLSDNIAYLIIDEKTGVAAAVDPAEPEKVLEAAKKEGATIKLVLTTHHHWDHAAGNPKMKEAIESLTIYGGDDRVDALTHKVGDGDSIKISDNIKVDVFSTPCHTTGHVLYLVSAGEGQSKALFTGDTLFIAGCGRFFEGTASQMYHALLEVVASLPHNTEVYCGHEYTVQNLKFAVTVEPENEALTAKLEWAKARRDKGESTVPSTIAEELSYNPFMRVKEPAVRSFAKKTAGKELESDDPVDIMAILRAAKNDFKG